MPDFPKGLNESLPLNFHSPYGCSKGAADQYVLDYARIYGLRATVFRHSSMYGGYQFSTADQRWIGWFCKQALFQSIERTSPFMISGNGLQVPDILYADDMVNLYMTSSALLDKMAGQAFNIGGGIKNNLSVPELLYILEKMLDLELNYEHIPTRESDQLYFVADLKKINEFTGWEPSTSVMDGLGKMLQWMKSVESI